MSATNPQYPIQIPDHPYVTRKPYYVCGEGLPEQRFRDYGDAQRHAWALLRSNPTTTVAIGVACCDGRIRCMEHWIIGKSGKFKWIGAEGDLGPVSSSEVE